MATFTTDHFTIRRKFLKVFGASFHVNDKNNELIGFSKQKAFKLREDIRVYTDESATEEVLLVRARQVIDFSAAYDIVDPTTNEKVGAAQRKGFSSMLRDSWELLDANDNPIGKLQEDSMFLATLRRFLTNIIPQTFRLDPDDGPPVVFKQRLNPVIYKLDVTIPSDNTVDRRALFGLAVLLAAIEGKQGR